MFFKINNNFGKKYKINEKVFSSVKSELEAYCLGFLMADGCLFGNSNGYKVNISINKKDIEILNIFKKLFKTNKPIYFDKRGAAILSINNKKIFYNLLKFGCTPKKSLTLRFPKINKYLIHHFIRGYFDGDGCVSFVRKKIRHVTVSIISSYFFCKKLKNILEHNIDLRINKISPKQSKYKDGFYSIVGFSGGTQTEKFYNYIYKNSHFFLKRKRNKFREFLKLRKINNDLPFYNQKYKIRLINRNKKIIDICSFSELEKTIGLCKRGIYNLVNKKWKQYKGWKIYSLRKIKTFC